MESEKVKEIKKALECISGLCKDDRTFTCYSCVISQNFTEKRVCKEALTLINALEGENERLSKELDSEWKDRRKAEEDLHKAQWKYKIGLAQSRKRNKELKDRIAELEKETSEQLKQFAERLKEVSNYTDEDGYFVVNFDDIDETLKEFISAKNSEH